MAIDRRTLLTGGPIALAAALSPGAAMGGGDALFAAARRGVGKAYSAAIFAPDGRDIAAVSLPGRGHDIAVCPVSRRCVVFARRPGNFAKAFSVDRSSDDILFEAPPDRHFYGHGTFSPDGRHLFATENDFEAGRGVIGVYAAAAAFRRVGEYPTHGTGPHDLAMLSDGRTLVVANGGLREHPDIGDGRRVLNSDSVRTSLAYIDSVTGGLLEIHELAGEARLSLRHLDIGFDDTVVVGGQIIEGSTGLGDAASRLVYCHRRQKPLVAIAVGDEAHAALSGYVSSVAVDAAGHIAAFTSSRTGSAVLIEIATGRLLGVEGLADVSGVARSDRAGRFVLTSGTGAIVLSEARGGATAAMVKTNWSWDNHAVRLGR